MIVHFLLICQKVIPDGSDAIFECDLLRCKVFPVTVGIECQDFKINGSLQLLPRMRAGIQK